jgi:outer membrane receptor protein involved in Fe transport
LVQQLILAIFYEHCVQRSKMIGRGNMMNLQRSLYLAGCAGLALTCPNIARAQAAQAPTTDQNTAAQADREPDEIVVTANKREQNLNDVGLSVTAISGEALAERRVTSVQDIAAAIPGLKFAESGTNTPIYTLRGIGFNEESLGVYPSVSVYIDEVPLPFPVLTLRAAFDLERVEALKGPQGILFGQNATGGAINYIAAKPTRDLAYGADISYGRFNQIDGTAFISGPLGENVSARLAVAALDSDGWQRSITRPVIAMALRSTLQGA